MDIGALKAALVLRVVDLVPLAIPQHMPDGSEVKTAEQVAALLHIPFAEAQMRLEIKAGVRHIRKLSPYWLRRGYTHVGQVIGSLGREHNLRYDQPTLFEVATPSALSGRKPNHARVKDARVAFQQMMHMARKALDSDDLQHAFYNAYDGMDLDVDSFDRLDPDDVDAAWMASTVARSGAWPAHFYTCRQIRRSAFEMLGFDETPDSDPHLEKYVSGQGRPMDIEPHKADLYAYALLQALADEDMRAPSTLYRGVNLHGYEFPEDIKEGAVLTLPLVSVASSEEGTHRFGTDITFHIKAERAVIGGDFITNEGLDESDDMTYEYVTGGRFEVTRVFKRTQPTYDDIVREIGPMPERDDYSDEDEWIQDLDYWRDQFRDQAEHEGLTVDEDGNLVLWENDRWVVEMIQRGVYDPATGGVIEVKDALQPQREAIPAYDWLFEGSMLNPELVETKDVFSGAATHVMGVGVGTRVEQPPVVNRAMRPGRRKPKPARRSRPRATDKEMS